MYKTKIGNLYIGKFSSSKDLIDSIHGHKKANQHLMQRRSSSGDTWMFGEFDPKHSIENIIKGDCSFYDERKERSFKSAKNAPRIRRRKKFSDIDGQVDVMRALNCSVTPFIKKTKVSAKGRDKVFNIALDMNASVKSKNVYKYVKSCVDIIATAINQGYMVEVNVVFIPIDFLSGETANGLHIIKLKDKRQRMDIKRIYSIAYPGFFRYFVITSEHLHDKEVIYGYGRASSKKQMISILEKAGFPQSDKNLLTYEDFKDGKLLK